MASLLSSVVRTAQRVGLTVKVRNAGPEGVGGRPIPQARPGLSKSPRMHLVTSSCPACSRDRPRRAPYSPAAIMWGASVIARRPPREAADLPPPRRVVGRGGMRARALTVRRPSRGGRPR